jgi:Mg2+-importing ATPase
MGTVVRAGSGTGVVVATGGDAEFGRIAVGLGQQPPETEFQVGLRKFSMLLVQVAGVLTGAIFVINVALHKPVLDALLFSLAIAVGISPQLLPAVVSTSLAAGSRQLAQRKVLVKRLVCIEDLGDIDVLFTDKTGTLTEGSLRFMRSAGPDGVAGDEPLLLGLLCNEAGSDRRRAAGGNPLDVALWDSPAAAGSGRRWPRYRRLATLPFDHERRLVSVLIEDDRGSHDDHHQGRPGERSSTGARRSRRGPHGAGRGVRGRQPGGRRGHPRGPRPSSLTPADEHGLTFRGLLVFLDPPKPDARAALQRLAGLGDHGQDPHRGQPGRGGQGLRRPRPASPARWPPAPTSTRRDRLATARRDHGLRPGQPEHKAQIVRAQRPPAPTSRSSATGVNDAGRAARRRRRHLGRLGHRRGQGRRRRATAGEGPGRAGRRRDGRADLREHDEVRADGHVQQLREHVQRRRASLFLTFLPMLPRRSCSTTCCTTPASWPSPPTRSIPSRSPGPPAGIVGFIRRFMLFFGPISSVFDFITFGVMLWVFHAGPALFRSGWFVESLATQTLVIFAIRTRRIPFFRSRPSLPLTLAALAVVTVGTVLPFTATGPPPGLPAAARPVLPVPDRGDHQLPGPDRGRQALVLPLLPAPATPAPRHRTPGHRVRRRAARFTTRTLRPPAGQPAAQPAEGSALNASAV